MDVKETGQKKSINGFSASQVMMTMQIDSPELKQRGMKMNMEMELWLSPDVPGAGELRAFYQRNLGKFPWAAMAQGANPSLRSAMSDLQKKIAQMNGIPVQQIVHMRMGGGAASQAQAAQSDPRMAAARAQLEAMAKQGGAQGEAAQKALARMGGAMAGAGGSDITMDASAYSSASIPDSVFAIPAGYTQQK